MHHAAAWHGGRMESRAWLLTGEGKVPSLIQLISETGLAVTCDSCVCVRIKTPYSDQKNPSRSLSIFHICPSLIFFSVSDSHSLFLRFPLSCYLSQLHKASTKYWKHHGMRQRLARVPPSLLPPVETRKVFLLHKISFCIDPSSLR